MAAMILTLYVAAVGTLTFANSRTSNASVGFSWWQPQMLLLVSGGTIAIITMGSLYKTMQLRSGGAGVAEQLGGRRLQGNSRDPLERRLWKVVEEMALAAGTTVPPVYLLDNEPGINAFAAGFTPGDAVIGVNRGTVENLSRDELQGVIAHEFSHILNGDRQRLPVEQSARERRRADHRARVGDDRHRLRGLVFRQVDQGRRLAAARISGGRVGRSVYSQSGRHRRSAQEDRRTVRWLADGIRGSRKRQSLVLRQLSPIAFSGTRDAPAVGQTNSMH
ncbi:MAG: M48 family metalloprotease [Planctomycetia bacterium]|nr:M48 family metalloprotease [Planctomycetia bacterium]